MLLGSEFVVALTTPQIKKPGIEIMTKYLLSFAFSLFVLFPVMAQAADSGCEAKAVSKAGKPLAGAAKTSFMKKCEADAATASATAACEPKALSKDGKNLSGAAKNSFMKKCVADTKAGK
jgi:hypothetical protein